MKNVTIFSDGSSLGNPGPGGYGTIIKFGVHIKELTDGEFNTTNNRMELLGAIRGVQALKEPCNIHLISDSKYVTTGITEWLPNWIKRGWKTASKKPVKNVDLWQEWHSAIQGHNITTEWVKGHSGHPENERCDTLAFDTANDFKNNKGN